MFHVLVPALWPGWYAGGGRGNKVVLDSGSLVLLRKAIGLFQQASSRVEQITAGFWRRGCTVYDQVAGRIQQWSRALENALFNTRHLDSTERRPTVKYLMEY